MPTEETMPDDAALFDAAVADEPVAVEATAEPEAPAPQEPEATEQHRDEAGKFAKKEAAETKPEDTADAPTADEEKGGQIPSWRLREINEEKRAAIVRAEAAEAERQQLRAELEQLRRQPSVPAKEPIAEVKPDPLLDPEAYEAYLERKFEERANLRERNLDMASAHRTHGKVFEEAYQAAQNALRAGDPQLKALMNSTSTPGEDLVKWHRERQTMREVGNDPNAWLEKKLEERLADPAFLAKAVEKARGVASATPTQNGGKPAINLPPSLSHMTRADSLLAGSDDNDMSDEALFSYATR
jgi:hypothetical protein